MAQQIQDIMTRELHTIPSAATLQDVARLMRDKNIGDVLVIKPGGKLCGIVTDRDVVVRGLADGKPLDTIDAGKVCSDRVISVSPTDEVDTVIDTMRKNSIRRVPVVRDGQAVGIVSLGDLARAKDPGSVLGAISAAPPSR
jgi:signal-transduction protein with cAMP-binding, CBS, and nucleotidyltransferase domain